MADDASDTVGGPVPDAPGPNVPGPHAPVPDAPAPDAPVSDAPGPEAPIAAPRRLRSRRVRRRLLDAASTAAPAVIDRTGDAVDAVRPIAGAVADAAGAFAGVVGPAAVHLAASTIAAARNPRRRWRTRASARRNEPLPNLFRVHPEARLAPVRELGLLIVPVDEILGTAVEGPTQRGRDFKPLKPFRSSNWEARWQRIRNAVERMESLPPIDVLRTRDGYWVTDGHNRVAAAIDAGQLAVDADVRAVILPGEPQPPPSGSLAPVLAEAAQVEAAARGQLSRGATLGRSVHDHGVVRRPVEPPDGAPARDGDTDGAVRDGGQHAP